ncbi:hypothetical protein DFH08DRAFT_790065 [Mycena albidolilacea]|uniref:Uncharacterized protein n=1 Tax=Mycena albidolilacea TaxID=1033008 RepID=A0AAD6ZD11_9AGAR|nr:hypothetical protein DFH08DRAFT_790065 [Mycena albidolilacea]
MESDSLPLYSPSHPSPSYSQDPTHDETRLDLSPRVRRGLLPTGIFTKVCGSATVVLFDQEPTARVPSYGIHGSVRGSLILEQERSQICEVVAKLEGRLETATIGSGALTIKVAKITHCLWSSSSSSSACPETVNIACNFPTTFQHNDCEYRLPPSYVARFPGFPSLFAKCTYSLTISITKDRQLGFLSRTKLIYVPIDYNPQTVPARGIPTSPSFLASVKTMPEEWHQSSFVVNTRSSSNLFSIQCQAFIPSVKVFGLSHTIPLHLQLCGPLSSLRELVLPSNDREECPVRVYITRMVTFEHRGKSTWRLHRIGEGSFSPLPPMADYDCRKACDPCVETLDWNGEIKCDSAVSIGGFQAAGLTVKDFITLEIIPPKTLLSPLLSTQHAIRLVTETFIEPT